MERLKLKYADATKALNTLKEIMRNEFSIIVRDASIQRHHRPTKKPSLK